MDKKLRRGSKVAFRWSYMELGEKKEYVGRYDGRDVVAGYLTAWVDNFEDKGKRLVVFKETDVVPSTSK